METSARKIIATKRNPAYDAAPWEWTMIHKDGTADEMFAKAFPFRYATEEHALAASQPGADPRINTVPPFTDVYEDEQP